MKLGCQIPQKIRSKLTADHKYLRSQMGTKDKPLPLPFQPVHDATEYTVFDEGAIDFDETALEWCNHVDGVTGVSKVAGVT